MTLARRRLVYLSPDFNTIFSLEFATKETAEGNTVSKLRQA